MRLSGILNGRRRLLWARLVGNGLAQALAAIATTLLVRHTFDHWLSASQPAALPALAWIGAGLITVAALRAWLRARERIDAELLGQEYVYRVRLTVFDRLGALAPRVLQRRRRGSLMLRFTGDLSALRQWVSLGLARLSVAGVTTGVALAALGYLNPTLALAISLILVGVFGMPGAVVPGVVAGAVVAAGPPEQAASRVSERAAVRTPPAWVVVGLM